MELPKKLKKEFEDALKERLTEFMRDFQEQHRLMGLLESAVYKIAEERLQEFLGLGEAFGRMEIKKNSFLHKALEKRDPPLLEEIVSKVVGEGVTLTKKELEQLRKQYRESFLDSARYALHEAGKRAGGEWIKAYTTELVHQQLQDFLSVGGKAEEEKGEDQEEWDGAF